MAIVNDWAFNNVLKTLFLAKNYEKELNINLLETTFALKVDIFELKCFLEECFELIS